MVIYGWYRPPVLLATKLHLCSKCGDVTAHAILRIATWAHVFWVPFLLLWVSHRLVCLGCGQEEKLGFREVRQALRSGRLRRPAQPGFREWARAQFEETSRMPSEAELERVDRNPKRGPWDLWLKAWPVLVAAIVGLAVVNPFRGPEPVPYQPPMAHTCFVDQDDYIAGCRLLDGTMDGLAQGKPTTCWFVEPLPTGDYSLRCDD